MSKARITEIFSSIQGEGPYLGVPFLFVRFFDCNLTCSYCDTKLNSFQNLSVESVLEKIISLKGDIKFISFTGGEPLLEADFLKEILPLTRFRGFRNYLDTNATLPESLEGIVEFLDIISADLKLPTSTGIRPFWEEHREFIETALQHGKEIFLKAVITLDTEEEDLMRMLSFLEGLRRDLPLILQPNTLEWGRDLSFKIKKFQEICLKKLDEVRVIPQIHKILELP